MKGPDHVLVVVKMVGGSKSPAWVSGGSEGIGFEAG